jgi:hypothetical protein
MDELLDVVPESVSTDDDDLVHFWDCNPALAFCGAKMDGAGWDDEYDEDSDEPDDCAMCVMIRGEGLVRVCCGC